MYGLGDTIKGYLVARAQNNESNYVTELVGQMSELMKTGTNQDKMDIVQHLVFLNIRGHDTSWADFWVLEVMSIDEFAAKRVAFTAASQMWNSQSDVVLMATNRIQKDLTSVQPLLSSLVLTSLPPYLSRNLSHDIASDVIALMSAAKPVVRQKAIMTFYHICLRYTDALRPGFHPLRLRLEDQDSSVVFSALTVMSELCAHNVQNFVGMIPIFHKMLVSSTSNWVSLRLINLLRMLSLVEPRLPKKLAGPFTTILETTQSVTVLFECVRTIIEIPITNSILLTLATQRMQAFLEHEDQNLRFLCLSLFIKLIEIQPRLVAQHRELITQCLDSTDESTRLLALDLLAALANEKTIDGIVGRMFSQFKQSKGANFKDQLFQRVMGICRSNDYNFVNDFDWYIDTLKDFMQEGGFTCYDAVADQMLDLATRVPSTRERLVVLMGELFESVIFKDATEVLLAAAHIIGEYSEDCGQFDHLMQPLVLNTNERVQESVIHAAFRVFLRATDEAEIASLEKKFLSKLAMFECSMHAEVQDCAALTKILLGTLGKSQTAKEWFQEQLGGEAPDDFAPIDQPAELDDPIEIFADDDDDIPMDQDAPGEVLSADGKTKVDKERRRPVVIRKQKQTAQKPKVLKASRDKIVAQQKSRAQPAALSNELAGVDLTEMIQDEEVTSLPRPMPYVQTELMKNQKEHSRSGHRHRHRRGESSSTSAAPPPVKPRPSNPVTVPAPRSRVQVLGENGDLKVSAVEFYCSQERPNVLDIDLSLYNAGSSSLTAIDISLQEIMIAAGKGTRVDLPPLASFSGEVKMGETATHRVSMEVKDIVMPHRYHIFFMPVGGKGDTLAAELRVFPSHFLCPGKAEEFEAAKDRAGYKETWNPPAATKANILLQILVNVLRASVMANSDPQSRSLYSRSTGNEDVICTINIKGGVPEVELTSSSSPLAQIIIREIGRKLSQPDGTG